MVSEVNGDPVVCRTCISECVEYKSIHQQGIFLGEVRTLASMLCFVTNLEFVNDEVENFPSNICARCVQNLAKSFAFKKLVLETDKMLRRQCAVLDCVGGITDTNLVEICEGSVIEDVETESADSTVEEHHIVIEDGTEGGDGTEQLHELAAAAQFKRSMDNMEYVPITELEGFVEADEAAISDNNSQSNLDHEMQYCDEDVVHDVTESEDVYQVVTDDDEREKDYEEIYEIREVSNDCSMSDNIEEELLTPDLNQPDLSTIKTEETMGDCDVIGDFKSKQPKVRKKKDQPKLPNPDLQCKVCGKQLSNQHSFKYHMQLHSDATPYLCSLCGEGFKTRNAYEGHIVIHDPNNPNTCEICGKSYRQSSSLRTHMLSHTGERPFQCDICGKSMTQKSGYKKHMLVHTGEKPHTCDVCGREFRYSSNLIAHKRCHTGERPYECKHCKRAFPTSEQMKRHSLVHTGERPFQCTVCFKSFKRRASVITHQHTCVMHEPEIIVDHKVCKSNVVELY
ncbi:uncharacterized protein [Eurosta solidaginis]|uniref:uncharacterized protein n=1 Tax=Eurosta solidaginis TaxID=178769 RepID=UPI00353091EF